MNTRVARDVLNPPCMPLIGSVVATKLTLSLLLSMDIIRSAGVVNLPFAKISHEMPRYQKATAGLHGHGATV